VREKLLISHLLQEHDAVPHELGRGIETEVMRGALQEKRSLDQLDELDTAFRREKIIGKGQRQSLHEHSGEPMEILEIRLVSQRGPCLTYCFDLSVKIGDRHRATTVSRQRLNGGYSVARFSEGEAPYGLSAFPVSHATPFPSRRSQTWPVAVSAYGVCLASQRTCHNLSRR